MFKSKVADNIFQTSINLHGILFEGLWEIPEGVSINSYIVKGDDVAIIDGFLVEESVEPMMEYLEELNIDSSDVKYLIVNHTEPDHSGWIKEFRKVNPDVTIVCNAKSQDLIKSFYDIDENILVLEDGDTVDLGQGHVLKAVMMPNVHWPDTMSMFDEKTGTLFSCDMYGSFGEISEGNYDDNITEEDVKFYEREAMRYYSNIMASFSTAIKSAVEKTKELPYKIIAPSHGIVWRENPDKIIEDYIKYASYQRGVAEEKITVIWGSMYGMTEEAAMIAVDALKDEGIEVDVHNVPESNVGEILKSVWRSTGVVLAMPTYEYKMFPAMFSVLDEIGKKRVQGRKALRLGSYGWSGGAQRELDYVLEHNRMNWEFLDPVEFKGKIDEEDINKLKAQVKELVRVVRETVK